jgi:DNA-binding SARP family transcriptional activator
MGQGGEVLAAASEGDQSESGAPAVARLSLLGGFRLCGDAGDRTPRPGMAAQALKVLGVHGAIHVEELVELLWPGDEPERGRVRLRNVLTRVRQHVGPLVLRTGDVLSLDERVEVDATRFETEARMALGRPWDDPRAIELGRRALSRYGGELLPFDRYAEWTREPRDRLRRRWLDLVDRLAMAAEARGDRERAVELLLLGIEEEPEVDDRYLAAARILLEVGRPGRALVLLRRLREAARHLHLVLPADVEILERRLLDDS